MAKKDFPNLLHVTAEQDSDGTKFLIAHKGGIYDAVKIGQAVECAIYKLVKIGKISARPKFED